MSTPLLISYVALWILVVVLAVFLVGTMREVALMRSKAPPLRTVEEDGPAIGTPLPPLLVSPVNGRAGSPLTEYQGKRGTLIAILSPLCESCQDLVSALNATIARHRDALGVIVILDGGEGVSRAFLGLYTLNCPVILDGTGEVIRMLGVANRPFGLLYDAHGTLMIKAAFIDDSVLAEVIDDGLNEDNRHGTESGSAVATAHAPAALQ
jgi:methylamine dehydrogenase accessory protein MauD